MCDVVVRHGQDGNLCDRAVAALNTACTLVDGRQIHVHVTGEAATAGNLFSRGRHLTKGVAVGRKICENDENMLSSW